jgi:hypothetical protein
LGRRLINIIQFSFIGSIPSGRHLGSSLLYCSSGSLLSLFLAFFASFGLPKKTALMTTSYFFFFAVGMSFAL